MNADSAFQIGSSHAVCQDYALAGAGGAYVVVSDGCSSSPDTDIGARLLAKAAERVLCVHGATRDRDVAELHREAARLALKWCEVVGLRPQAVDATLLTAHLDGGELIVGCSGDGVVCFETRGGALEVYVVAYPSGYPLYPAYAHQPERLNALEEAGRTSKEVTRFRTASNAEDLRPDGGARGGDATTEVFRLKAADYLCATLFSDGVHSFFQAAETATGARNDPVPLDAIVRELVSFKNTRGAFVARRLKRFLKDCRRNGWRHSDDLAVGALHLGGCA